MSLNFQATRFQCTWPWSTLVLLCDGRVVCGCGDPRAQRVLGDLRTTSVHDVWTGEVLRTLRTDLNGGGSMFCGDCALKLPIERDAQPVIRPIDAGPLPNRLYVECTIACNISCQDACCAPETGIARTRRAGMLDFDLFCRVIDEIGASLVRVDFFNYGETFLHKRAVDMCAYVKSRYPHIYLYTSTNGLAFTESQARQLVHSGIDEVTFSIDGATQAAYEQYRRRGQLVTALANLRAMADEKRRSGRDVPFLNWRYILFTWNDSDEEMRLARTLAADLGVDRLCWELTDHPEHAYSRRFAPGSEALEAIRHAVWDDNNLGSAIPGATPRARIDVRTLIGGVPILARAGRSIRVRTRVHNLSTRAFPARASYGRRLVRLGAQLCDEHGALIDRDFARAWLPHTLAAGEQADVSIELDAPHTAGRYRLKFDLVSEGIDWFERCGSPTTITSLWVRPGTWRKA